MQNILNKFQETTLELINTMYEKHHSDTAKFEELEHEIRGIKETYIYKKISVRDEVIGIYIYQDGAQFNGDKVDRRWERYDFDNLDELRTVFIRTLEDYLFYPDSYVPNRTIFMILGDYFRSILKK